MHARAFAAIIALTLLSAAGSVCAEEGPRWQELSATQRSALKPLERDWSSIDASRKQKWLEIASRFHTLPPEEQQRMSNRMTQWAKLSPAERGQARQNFQEARQLAPQERQARWQAYQALTPEQRKQLGAGKSPVAPVSTAREANQTKSNIVPNPAYAPPPRPVAPTVVQAAPGATTSLITKRPAPPAHQQPGLPKIAATPGLVDKTTLLPQRGPQAAAARPVDAGASAGRRGAR